MYWFKNSELKKMLIYLSIALLILGIGNIIISFNSINNIKHDITINNARIINEVVKKYPEAEQDVIKVINDMDDNNVDKSFKILKKYGIDESEYYTKYLYDLKSNIIVNNLIFYVITFIIFFFITAFFIKKIYKKINNINKNTSNVLNENYNLNSIENNEGDLSILNNNIYKITTSLKEQKELLNKEKYYLKDALSDISHQLKTPLTSLNIINDILKRDLSKKEKEVFINKMNLILNKIEWLVSSLLKLSQLDSRTIELENKKISVRKLINTSIKPLLLLMELKNIKVVIKGNNKISINGDFNWLSEALGNIIKNSVEHTDMNGQIDINYIDNPLYTKIVIRDNGEGIDKKDLPFIFNRFYKAKNSHKDSIGIGLALAKTIINSQNGDIKVNSEKGTFTEFIIKIYRSH